jgi:hypothetical protein
MQYIPIFVFRKNKNARRDAITAGESGALGRSNLDIFNDDKV